MDNSYNQSATPPPSNPYAQFMPDPVTPPRRRIPKKLIVLAAATLILVIVVIIAAIFQSSGNKKLLPAQSVVSDNKISADNASLAISQLKLLMGSLAARDFKSASSEVMSSSPMANPEFSPYLLRSYAGPNIDWTQCKLEAKDSYAAASLDLDHESYDVVYLQYVCLISPAESAVYLTFDVRKSLSNTSNPWLVYYIVNSGDKQV